MSNRYHFDDYSNSLQEWNTQYKWNWHKIFLKEWRELYNLLLSEGVKKDIIVEKHKQLWDDFIQKMLAHKDNSDFLYQCPLFLRTIYKSDREHINPLFITRQ